MEKIYLVLFALLLTTGPLFAGLDDLDTSFGPAETGIVTLDLNVADVGDKTVINDMEVQDGGIIVAGYHLRSGDYDIVVARFNANGTLDNSFGTGGIVITDLGTDRDIAYALSLSPSGGKIVVAGEKDGDFAVLRYNSDGTPDTSFGTDGIVTTDFGGDDVARDVVAVFGGGIVVVGYSSLLGVAGDFALAKYTSSGALDSAFDGSGATPGNGKFKTDFGSADKAYAFTYVGTRIVVAGLSANNFALAKYDANTGALDTTFDGDGKLTTDFGGSDVAYAIKAVGTTSLIVAGKGGNDFAVAKYLNSNGALDTTFSTDGKLTTDIGASSVDYASDLVIDSTSTILVVGKTAGDFGIVRYNFSGDLDPTFDSDGKLVLDLGGDQDIPTSIERISNDKFLVAGKKGFGSSVGEMALVQYGSYLADASVSLTASADTILVGSEVTYTIRLSNNGSDPTTVYSFDADFDPSFEFVSLAITEGECNFYEGGDNELNCEDIDSLAGGGSVEVTLVLRATVAGSLEGWAGASVSPDNNSSNNSATLVVTAVATEDELPPLCGDDRCDETESCSSCEADCGVCEEEDDDDDEEDDEDEEEDLWDDEEEEEREADPSINVPGGTENNGNNGTNQNFTVGEAGGAGGCSILGNQPSRSTDLLLTILLTGLSFLMIWRDSLKRTIRH